MVKMGQNAKIMKYEGNLERRLKNRLFSTLKLPFRIKTKHNTIKQNKHAFCLQNLYIFEIKFNLFLNNR